MDLPAVLEGSAITWVVTMDGHSHAWIYDPLYAHGTATDVTVTRSGPGPGLKRDFDHLHPTR